MSAFTGVGAIGGSQRVAAPSALVPGVLGNPVSGDSIVKFATRFRYEQWFRDGIRTDPTDPTDTSLFVDSRQVPDGRFWLVQALGSIYSAGAGNQIEMYMMPPEKINEFAKTVTANTTRFSRGRGIFLNTTESTVNTPGRAACFRPFVLPSGWFLRSVVNGNGLIGGAINIELMAAYVELENSVLCE